MSSHFANILKHAKSTCDPKNSAVFKHNFVALKQLVDKLVPADLSLNPDLLSRKHFNRPNKAPCTYVNIFECETCTISVFILAESYTMPLHDHPQIHGILKTIAGKIQVQSYTSTGEPIAPAGTASNTVISVVQEPPRILLPTCDSATLSPTERNFHEITAVDGPAAFFDILTPPYDSLRKCSFYAKSVGSVDVNLEKSAAPQSQNRWYLRRIPCPDHYYTDDSNEFS